jgi:hypothetical protein
MEGLNAAYLGVDACALRDVTGKPIIPHDQVKGLMRAALRTLADAKHTKAIGLEASLFGGESPRASDGAQQDTPNRGELIFSDLSAPQSDRSSLSRVAIDPGTGAAKAGALLVIELCAPLGHCVEFTGKIIARGKAAANTDLVSLLDACAKLIPFAGAMKTAGFGEVTAAEVTVDTKGSRATPPANHALPGSVGERPDRVTYCVTFDRPVLVDAQHEADNVFSGSATISGAAIKGALARTLELSGSTVTADRDALGEALSQIRISHAVPVDAAYKPTVHVFPDSMIADPVTGTIRDALLAPKDKAPLINGRAPLFPLDWKQKWFGSAANQLGWPEFAEPEKLPRGHVRIGKGYIAEDAALYVDAARAHLKRNPDGDGWAPQQWLLTLDRNDAGLTHFKTVCETLEAGIDGVGSTAATATFKLPANHSAAGVDPCPVAGETDLWAVTLLTPALLLDPRNGTPHDQYAHYWEQASGGKLETYFGRQRLAGRYLSTRFRIYGTAYYPFILTEPGATFLLKGDLRTKLTEFLRSGLPLPKVNGVDLTWRNCPFVPQNGFGQIAVNHIDHKQWHEGVTYV